MKHQCRWAAALACGSLLLLAADRFDTTNIDPAASGMDTQRLASIPLRMKEFVDEGKTSGAVTIVARHGHVTAFDVVGYQDIESRKPMQKDTLFRIASLTKPITCAAVMMLVDDGRVALVDPVEKYLPEYKGQKLSVCAAGFNCAPVAPARPINIEDLMTHTSGLPNSADVFGGEPKTLAELVTKGAHSTLLFEPGTRWNYSNIGIDILGRIIEVVAKKPFDVFLRERLFAPLGMDETTFFVPPDKRSRVATLYTYTDGKLVPEKAEWGAGAGIPSPAGGLISTASDMLRFNQMMLNKGILNGQRVLSPAAVELMTISHTGDMKAGWVPGVGHGFGYEVVRNAQGMFRYNSLGSYVKGGAYRTYEWVDPARDLTGVIMMQRTNGNGDTADEINAFMAMSTAAIVQ